MLRKRQHSHRQDQPSSQKNTQRNQSNVVRSRRRVKSKKSFYRRFRRNTTVLGSAVILSICLYRLASSVSFYSPPVGTIRPSNRNWSPVTVGCYFEAPKKDLSSKIVKIKRLPLYDEDRYPSKRQMPWTASNDESQQKLRDSKRYRAVEPTGATDDNCEVRREWQQQYHPNCNAVHENDFTKFYAESSTGVDENIRLVASGYFRDVWKVPDKDDSREWVASKTLRYKHQFTNRNFDRHRRDALTTEETTASPYTIDIYAYCVHTMFSEFSDEGSLSDLIWPKYEKQSNLTMKDRVNFALEAARGFEAVHFAGGSQEPSVAHTDISPSQFLMVDGSLKLNDFNRARFIPSASNGTSCPFRVYKNPGKFRSPEEYELADETEKIDIYSFGNVLFSLLTESWPFQNLTVDEAQKKVRNGERPQINMNTTDSHALMLMDVMQMSWRHNASDRPSSKDLVKYIEKEVTRLDISA